MSENPDNPKDGSTTNNVAIVQNHSLWDWVKDNAYLWAWLPVGLAISVGLIIGYNGLTGRQPVDELPIGVAGNLVVAIVSIVLAVATNRLWFPRVDTTKAGVPWWQAIALYTVKLLLLWGIWYAISHG